MPLGSMLALLSCNVVDAMTVDTKAARARAEAATPGPWAFDDGNVFCQALSDARHARVMAHIEREPSARDPDFDPSMDPSEQVCSVPQSNPDVSANEVFIAAARTDVPALADEIDRLRAAIVQALEQLDLDGLPSDVDGANETLREALGILEGS